MNEYNFFFWCSGMREDLHYHILTFSTWYRAPCGVIIQNYQIINNILDTKLSSYIDRKANKNYEKKNCRELGINCFRWWCIKTNTNQIFLLYIKNAAQQLFSKKEKSYLLLANDNNWLSIWWCFFNDSPDTDTFITHMIAAIDQ